MDCSELLVGGGRIIFKEMLPNLTGTILVCATLTVPLAIPEQPVIPSVTERPAPTRCS